MCVCVYIYIYIYMYAYVLRMHHMVRPGVIYIRWPLLVRRQGAARDWFSVCQCCVFQTCPVSSPQLLARHCQKTIRINRITFGGFRPFIVLVTNRVLVKDLEV